MDATTTGLGINEREAVIVRVTERVAVFVELSEIVVVDDAVKLGVPV